MGKAQPMLVFPGLHEFTKNGGIPPESGFDYKWGSQRPARKNMGKACAAVYTMPKSRCSHRALQPCSFAIGHGMVWRWLTTRA